MDTYKKKYEDALERAKKIVNNKYASLTWKDWLKNTFSELKESEDERIKKEIIDYFNSDWAKDEGITRPDWIDWLKKQGEKKDSEVKDYNSIDPHFRKPIWYVSKVNGKIHDLTYIAPKFHEGEWLCENEPNNYARFIQILEIQSNEKYRISRDIHNDEDIVKSNFLEKYYHKFDIKDVKDGDILQLGGVTAIFQEYIGNGNCKCYCSVYNEGFEIPSQDGTDNSYGCHDAIPATKEQRDALMKAMTNAGYTFDFEKKKLRRMMLSDFFKAEYERGKADALKDIKWSEEDEEMLDNAVYACLNTYGKDSDTIDWLKSIKQRIGG